MSGVTIICFAASYALTLVLEITRLFFRSGLRGAAMLALAGAGLFAHSVYLFYRAINTAGSPLSSAQDWCMVAAWVLAAVYLHLTSFRPKTAFGVFILPLVLGLIAVGTFWADPQPFPREPASRVWGIIHGASILLAAVAVSVGFAAGLMYLGQAYRLKHKLPPQRGLRLPSLEWLRRANSRAVGYALVMLAVGILSGMLLNLINAGPGTERLPWNDPVVLSTAVMFAWLVVCTGIGVFYRPAREGRKVAFLTVFSFLFLVVALGMVLFADTRHGGIRREEGKSNGGVQGSGFGVQGSGFRVQGSGFRVQGSGFGVQGSGFRVQGSGFRVQGSESRGHAPADAGCDAVGLRFGSTAHRRLRSACCPLSTVHCPPPTCHLPLPAAHLPLATCHCLLPTTYCLLPTAYCLLPTAYCLLPTAYYLQGGLA